MWILLSGEILRDLKFKSSSPLVTPIVGSQMGCDKKIMGHKLHNIPNCQSA